MSSGDADSDNRWLNATFIQRLLSSWVYRLIVLGNKRDLKESDLYKCIPDYESQNLGGKLQSEFNKELHKRDVNSKYVPSLLKAVFRANRFYLLLYIAESFVQNCILRVIQPLLLGEIVYYFEQQKVVPYEGLNIGISLALLWLTSVTFSYLGNYILTGGSELGIRVRIACSYMLYQKALRLSTSALEDAKIGQIVNMMANNFNRFELAGRFLPYTVSSPLHLLITALILWKLLGVSTLAGSSVFVFQLLFQVFMGKAIAKFRYDTSKITDERVRILNESVSAMKVIKMYTWENKMVGQVEQARKKEISKQLVQSTMSGLASDVSHLFGKIALFVSILVLYLTTGATITPIGLFIAMSFFENLRFSFRLFNLSIAYCAESLTTLSRLREFLLLEEKSVIVNTLSSDKPDSQISIVMDKVVAKWCSANNIAALNDVSLEIKEGELVAVVGPVGSGKTSLLQSLMGELTIVQGSVQVCGKLAYVPQEAWLHTGTIRDNIQLFSTVEDAKYKEILNASTLNRDIAHMDLGDQTMVGEKGALLSGGQKARVNLARALCSNADIYLLDDPLSAVDASVGKLIFNDCIKRFLKGKTTVLVTHQVQYLRNVDKIIILKDGKSVAIGTYKELTDRGIKLEMLVKKDREDDTVSVTTRASFSKIKPPVRKLSVSVANEVATTGNVVNERASDIETQSQSSSKSENKREAIAKGTTVKSLWNYVKSGGGIPAFVLILIFALVAQGFFNLTDIYLSIWSSARDCPLSDGNQTIQHQVPIKIDKCIWFLKTKDDYFFTYIVLISCLIFLWVARSFVFYTVTNLAAKNLHVKVIRRLFYAPMSFFETNPTGRILNRLTKDMGNIDDVLPYILCESLMVAMLELGFLVVIVYYYIIMIIPATLLIVACLLLGYFYIKPGRDLQKLDSKHSSPVYSHLSSSIQGIQTIRSFNGESAFKKTFCFLLDKQTSASVINTTSGSLYRTGIEFACVLFLTCVHIMIYFSPKSDASSAGLALSACLQIAMALQYVALLVLNCVSLLVSVERVSEYKKLPREQLYKDDYGHEMDDLAKHSNKENLSVDNWPMDASIRFNGVSLYYDDNKPPSLNNISFEIKPGETVGIVGRTGAGKSSIVSALLRLTEPEGLIFIDDVPTKEISLSHLRGKISVIPQDPVLFSGPLRLSLDPYSKWPDFKLWRTLKQVQLDTIIGQLPDGLDTILKDGGCNFSVGQRQLLCLARTILLNNKILVLDEATANIDQRTDSIIQQSIRENMRGCTTLTVAHRLDTIIDCDKVMVLDRGNLLEFEEPYKLLQDSKSAFSTLLSETGVSTTEYLTQRAKEAYLNRCHNSLHNAGGTIHTSKWSISSSVLESVNENPNSDM